MRASKLASSIYLLCIIYECAQTAVSVSPDSRNRTGAPTALSAPITVVSACPRRTLWTRLEQEEEEKQHSRGNSHLISLARTDQIT